MGQKGAAQRGAGGYRWGACRWLHPNS